MTDIYLCLAGCALAQEIFTAPAWRQRWAAVVETADAARGSSPLVRLDPAAAPPLMQGDAAILVEDLSQLERLIANTRGWTIIVFQPSYLACLDAMRRQRQSIVSRRALSAGHVLSAEDLTTTSGGTGLDASLATRLTGARLTYDVVAGAPITFGLVEHGKIDGAVR